jgi:hypothetical protein
MMSTGGGIQGYEQDQGIGSPAGDHTQLLLRERKHDLSAGRQAEVYGLRARVVVQEGRVIPGSASDQMAWGSLYELALQIAEEHGATIPATARDVGRYDFYSRVTESTDEIMLHWKERLT